MNLSRCPSLRELLDFERRSYDDLLRKTKRISRDLKIANAKIKKNKRLIQSRVGRTRVSDSCPSPNPCPCPKSKKNLVSESVSESAQLWIDVVLKSRINNQPCCLDNSTFQFGNQILHWYGRRTSTLHWLWNVFMCC